jgi:16S rRNA (guanine966-N2)-methyltransferase
MRQAAFSSLGGAVVGARFLDLFAGSGAYGLEALSRGAAGGVFVERNSKAIACLRQNITAVCKSLRRSENEITVLAMDATGVPIGGGEPPDLVFVDPPYEVIDEVAPALFAKLLSTLQSKPNAIVAFEMPGEMELIPPGWDCLKRIGKGIRQPTVAFYRRAQDGA